MEINKNFLPSYKNLIITDHWIYWKFLTRAHLFQILPCIDSQRRVTVARSEKDSRMFKVVRYWDVFLVVKYDSSSLLHDDLLRSSYTYWYCTKLFFVAVLSLRRMLDVSLKWLKGVSLHTLWHAWCERLGLARSGWMIMDVKDPLMAPSPWPRHGFTASRRPWRERGRKREREKKRRILFHDSVRFYLFSCHSVRLSVYVYPHRPLPPTLCPPAMSPHTASTTSSISLSVCLFVSLMCT